MGKKREKTPHRGHLNKYGHLAGPQREFDFHDYDGSITPEFARTEVEGFIRECVRDGVDRVLIITGKGSGSRNGVPILRPAIQDYLQKHDQVKSVTSAKQDRGGTGAFEVELKT